MYVPGMLFLLGSLVVPIMVLLGIRSRLDRAAIAVGVAMLALECASQRRRRPAT